MKKILGLMLVIVLILGYATCAGAKVIETGVEEGSALKLERDSISLEINDGFRSNDYDFYTTNIQGIFGINDRWEVSAGYTTAGSAESLDIIYVLGPMYESYHLGTRYEVIDNLAIGIKFYRLANDDIRDFVKRVWSWDLRGKHSLNRNLALTGQIENQFFEFDGFDGEKLSLLAQGEYTFTKLPLIANLGLEYISWSGELLDRVLGDDPSLTSAVIGLSYYPQGNLAIYLDYKTPLNGDEDFLFESGLSLGVKFKL